MYGLTLIWALAAVYGQQEAPIIRISTLVRRHPPRSSHDKTLPTLHGRSPFASPDQ